MKISEINLNAVLSDDVKVDIENEKGFDAPNTIFAATIKTIDEQNREAGYEETVMRDYLAAAYNMDKIAMDFSVTGFGIETDYSVEENREQQIVLFGLLVTDQNSAIEKTSIGGNDKNEDETTIPDVLYNYALRQGINPREFLLQYHQMLSCNVNRITFEVVEALDCGPQRTLTL